jgi:hypothetical protein
MNFSKGDNEMKVSEKNNPKPTPLIISLVNLDYPAALRISGATPECLASIGALFGCSLDHGIATLRAARVGSCRKGALRCEPCRGSNGLELRLYFLDNGRQFCAIDQVNVSSLGEIFCLLRKNARRHHKPASRAPCGHYAI